MEYVTYIINKMRILFYHKLSSNHSPNVNNFSNNMGKYEHGKMVGFYGSFTPYTPPERKYENGNDNRKYAHS